MSTIGATHYEVSVVIRTVGLYIINHFLATFVCLLLWGWCLTLTVTVVLQ